jgi:NADPH:quinone reductase-like Zn-dependent oxidoreductase
VKALVIQEFGGPEVLEYRDWPDPEPAADEVLVAVRAVTVGRTLDVEVRRRGADFRVTLPRILGSDPAGVVVAVGDAVTAFAVGDRVASTSNLFCGDCEMCRAGLEHACEHHEALGVHRDGGAAELVAIPEQSVVRIPNHVDFEQAAAMAVNYPVAWNLLVGAGHLRPGQDVLVMAAAGGLGLAGVQIAKGLGANVIVAAGAGWKLERLRAELGVEATVDYSEPGWAERARGLTRDGRGADIVFENIAAPELFGGSIAALRDYGRLVTCGAHGGGLVELDVRELYRRHLAILGERAASRAMIHDVWRLVGERQIEPPPVSARFPLAEAAAAHEAAAGRDVFGRVVLVVDPPPDPARATEAAEA